MSDLVRLLGKVEDFLVAAGHRYAVIGGTAMVARVRVRPTQDVDVVMVVAPNELDALLAHATRHGFTFDPNDREIMEAGLVRLSLGEGAGVAGLDLIFCDSPFLERVVDRATMVDFGSGRLNVASVEDLLLLKLEAGRPIDLDDAIAIKDAFGEALDRAYLDREVKTLGIEAALRNLLG